MQFMPPLRLLLGITLLVTGGRLFWLFLGCLGFVFTFYFAELTIQSQPHSVVLRMALLAGALGAMAAVFLQKYAVLARGFFAGGYLLIEMLKALRLRTVHHHWLIFVVGGLARAILMSVVFGWTLIILFSLMGPNLILETFHFGPQLSELFFICLVILGIVIQSRLIRIKSPL